MAEFSKVAREYNRMCNSFVDNCENCRINPHEGNNIFACRNNVIKHPEKYESLIMQWAVEHPEPKYPTWGDWLAEIGLISWQNNGDGVYSVMVPTFKMFKSIPADIAQKFGIEPNGV